MKHLLLAIALATGLGLATPSPAGAFEPNADMGYAFEIQNWGLPASTGTLGLTAFMHTITLTDRTGTVMALVTSATKTNANEYYAREDAKRRDEMFYQYQVHIDEPKEGARLSLVVGTGSPSGWTAPGVTTPQDTDAKLVRMRFETDLVSVLEGTLAMHLGGTYFQATGKDPAAGAVQLKSLALPVGLYWRISPLPIPGLVFEPFADLDLGTALAGLGHDYGLRVAYYPHPTFALTARAEIDRFGIDAQPGAAKGTLADARVGSLGAQLLF